MTPPGADYLLTLRSRGQRPDMLRLYLDSDIRIDPPTWWPYSRLEWWAEVPDVAIRREQPIYQLDLRCFTGCEVWVVSDNDDSEERLEQTIDKLFDVGASEVWACRSHKPLSVTCEVSDGRRF